MAFSGNCGIEVEMQDAGCRMQDEILALLFSEELGLALEYLPEKEEEIISLLKNSDVPYQVIGKTTAEKESKISSKLPNQTPNCFRRGHENSQGNMGRRRVINWKSSR